MRSSIADRKLTFIPIIFFALRIWSTVRFLLLLLDSPVRQNPVLVTLHGSEPERTPEQHCDPMLVREEVLLHGMGLI
ncbi:hypothetical protein AAFF_G00233170 [Aldrovandia affinis]|uniref:Uncharacterized protein n=1 Tax=Aldrovandia affinis TaxID=143900 RepID=A0AAD7RF04_9TELE|nr:hypothetical protein AAFF_G00233170 [Aldrovandia affinis]